MSDCGKCVALQAALDCVAERLGEDRMRDADGVHYEAVHELVKELGAAYARHLRYLNAIDEAIGGDRKKLDTGEPSRSDAGEILELRRERDEARKLAEKWRNEHCGDCDDDRPGCELLPWEKK